VGGKEGREGREGGRGKLGRGLLSGELSRSLRFEEIKKAREREKVGDSAGERGARASARPREGGIGEEVE